MLIVLFMVLLAGSVLAAAWSIRIGRRTTAEAIRSVGQYGYGAASTPVAPRRKDNLVLERSLASVAKRFAPADYESKLRHRLIQAGLYDARPSRFLAFRLVSVLVVLSIALMYTTKTNSELFKLAAVGLAPFLGWMVPDSLLSSRIARRQAQIERDAADFIDLLAITVQAGLGLDQSMKIAAERLHGPLAEEARLMLNEIRIGQQRQDALRRMAERVDTPTIRSFARTMAQGETMGVSISQILKSLAIDARARKKAHAEELAQKAPVKMVFPLATCFFPAILIITAGPGILGIARALSGG
jgi:tight adherence protein C